MTRRNGKSGDVVAGVAGSRPASGAADVLRRAVAPILRSLRAAGGSQRSPQTMSFEIQPLEKRTLLSAVVDPIPDLNASEGSGGYGGYYGYGALYATYADAGSEAHSATVDWGDGTTEQVSTYDYGDGYGQVSASHVYADDGIYQATLTVTNHLGESTVEGFTANISNVAPSLSLAGDSVGISGQPYRLTLSSYDPGDDALESWTIDWGDGGDPQVVAGDAPTVEHVYAAGGESYEISATAADEDGSWSAPAKTISTNVFDAPADLRAVVISDARIDLSWQDRSDSESTFRIERSSDGGTTWQEVAYIPANQTSYSLTGLEPGVQYDLRVRARHGTGAYSDYTSTSAATLGFAPPSDLEAVVLTGEQVELRWADRSDRESTYRIDWSRDGGATWQELGYVPANQSSYLASGLEPGATYHFRVRGRHPTGTESQHSNVASATTTELGGASGLTATPISGTRVDLKWTDNTENESTFRIERSSDDGQDWREVAYVSARQTSYVATGLKPGSAYAFRVRARHGGGTYSDYSVPAAVTTKPVFAPSELGATVVSGSRIDLAWTDNSDDESTFRIDWSTNGGTTWSEYTYVAANVGSRSITGLNPGRSYAFRVRARHGDGTYSTYSDPVAAQTVPFAAPTNLRATVASTSKVELSWADAADNESTFRVERSTDGGETWSEITYVGANQTSHVVAGLDPGTEYQFRLRGRHPNGSYSPYSNEVQLRTAAFAAPSGLAVAFAGDQAELSWGDNSDDESTFRVERSTDGGETWSEWTYVPSGTTSYSATGLTPGAQYHYRVRARHPNGTYTGYTDIAGGRAPDLQPPGDLVATVVSEGRVDLRWTDSSGIESGFEIERSADGGAGWQQLATAGANQTSYSVTGLQAGQTYRFRVRARHPSGIRSEYSASEQVTPSGFAAPSDLLVRKASSYNSLSWLDNTSSEADFEVQRRQDGSGTFATLATVGAGSTGYTDYAVDSAQDYEYRVRARKAGTNSAFSPAAGTATSGLPAPENLSASVRSPSSVDLRWLDRSGREYSFRLEQSSDGGTTWQHVATASANQTSYRVTGLTPGTSYAFRVKTYDPTGAVSVDSNEAAADMPLLAAPGGLAANAVTGESASLSWSDNSGEEYYFGLEKTEDDGATWQSVNSYIGSNQTSYLVTGLKPGGSYGFRIKARHGSGVDSDYSETLEVDTRAFAAPAELAVTGVTGGRVDLAWTDSSDNEQYFFIERSGDGGTSWATSASYLSANQTSYSATGLAAGRSYLFRLRSRHPNGSYSPYSNVISVSTSAFGAPSGLAATVVSGERVSLQWEDNADNESYFFVERSENGGANWSTAASYLSADSTSYLVSNLRPGTGYTFRVRVRHPDGTYSAYSESVDVYTTPLGAPSDLRARVVSGERIDLLWNDNADNEAYFFIEQSQDAGATWSSTASHLSSNQTSYAVGNLQPGLTYEFRVRARHPDGTYSSYSNAAGATAAPLAAPADLRATVVSADRIDLSWTDDADNESYFFVERSQDDGASWSTAASYLGANQTGYSATGLVPGVSYTFRVRARHPNGSYSPYSNEVRRVSTPFAGPTGLVVTRTSDGRAELSWRDNSDDEGYFFIERSEDGGANWQSIASYVGANRTSYSATNLQDDRQYRFRVRSRHPDGDYSAWDYAGTASPELAAPSQLTATARGWVTELAWQDNADGETGFKIERRLGPSEPWVEAGVVGPGVTSFADSTSGGEHSYRVRAYVGTYLFSAYSNAREVTNARATADLTVAGVSDVNEEVRGLYVERNDGHDEGNLGPNGEPRPDNEADDGTGHRITPLDGDLVDATAVIGGVQGRWTLTFSDELMVWLQTAPDAYAPVRSGVASELLDLVGATRTLRLKIEGIGTSGQIRGSFLKADFVPADSTSGAAGATDVARFTVAGADLNVDSDNDDGYALPKEDAAEGRLEEDPSEIGKVVPINDGDTDHDGVADFLDGYNRDGIAGNADDIVENERFVPIRLNLDGPIDLDAARVRIEYAASDPAAAFDSSPAPGSLRLWTRPGAAPRGRGSVGLGGDFVVSGRNYSPEQLGINVGFGTGTLWLEGTAPSADAASRTIRVHVDPDGEGPLDYLLADSVFVTVEDAPLEPASLSGAPTVTEGAVYTLALDAGEVSVDQWVIDWGDGQSASAAGSATALEHVYADGPSSRTISTTATGGGETVAVDGISVEVLNAAPAATGAGSGDQRVTAGSAFELSLATFADSGFGPTESFEATIDWGDGTPPSAGLIELAPGGIGRTTTGVVSGRHNYRNPGRYAVSVTVRDDDGGQFSVSRRVEVVNEVPLYKVPGRIGETATIAVRLAGGGSHQSELGMFVVDAADGRTGDATPESPGYAGAALRSPGRAVVFSRLAVAGDVRYVEVPAGRYVGFYLVQDATTEHWLTGTFPEAGGEGGYDVPPGDLADPTRPNVFFTSPAANSDRFQHFRRVDLSAGGVRYEVEDVGIGGNAAPADFAFEISPLVTPGLAASPDIGGQGIRLQWSDYDQGAAGATVERAELNGPFSEVADLTAAAGGFTDVDVDADVVYVYRVRTYQLADGERRFSPYSAERSAQSGTAAPTAAFSGGGAVDEGRPGSVAFVSPSGRGPFTYSYDFDADGEFELSGVEAASAVVPAESLADGPSERVVLGRISDAAGLWSDYRATIAVRNVAPEVRIIGPAAAAPGTTTTFAAGVTEPGAADRDGGFIYEWSASNGAGVLAQGRERTFDFAPDAEGAYVLALTVSDKDGGSATATLELDVRDGVTTMPPAAPDGLRLVEVSEGEVSIAWDAPPEPSAVAYYEVLRDAVVVDTSADPEYADWDAVAGATHSYSVRAVGFDEERSGESGALTVSVPGVGVPPEPSGLRLAAASPHKATLAWDAMPGEPEAVYFEILRDGVLVGTSVGETFADARVAAGANYQYAVKAVGVANRRSAASPNLVVAVPSQQKLDAPENLRLNAASASDVELAWDSPGGGASPAAYEVLRDGVVVARTAAGSHTDRTVVPGRTYDYVVRSLDGEGGSSSATPVLRVGVPEQAPLESPAGLHLIRAAAGGVEVAWNGVDTAVKRYELLRDGNFVASSTSPAATDRGAVGGATHVYTVVVVDAAGRRSGPGGELAVAVPAATTGSIVASISGPATVNEGGVYTLGLSLTGAGTGTVTGWTIEWGDGTQVVQGTPATVTLAAFPASPNLIVRATAISDAEGQVPAGSIAVSVRPLAPTGLATTGAGNGDGASVTLAWNDNSAVESGYQVRRSADGVNWEAVATTGADATTYTDAGLAGETAYHYQVRAMSGPLASAPDGSVVTTPAVAPAAPSGLTAAAIGDDAIQLRWFDRSADETGFRVERRPWDGGSWQTLATVPADASGYLDESASPSTRYRYRVTAAGAAGESASGNEADATTGVPSPVDQEQLPVITQLALLNDTGTPGDHVTADPAITGRAYLAGGGAGRLPVQFDVNGDGSPEGFALTDATGGTFTIDLAGFIASPGAATVRVRAGRAEDATGATVYGPWTSIAFTYEPSTLTQPGMEPHVPSAASVARVARPRLRPDIGNVTGDAPTTFYGGSIFGGSGFSSFNTRYNPAGGGNRFDHSVDDDADPEVTSYSTAEGTYTVSKSDTHRNTVDAEAIGNGTWTYTESFASSYTWTTTFQSTEGEYYELVQAGTEVYELDADGDLGGSSYVLSHDLSQSYQYSWWRDAANPGEHAYTSSVFEQFTYDNSGEQTTDSGGSTASDEDAAYVAWGTETRGLDGSGAEGGNTWEDHNSGGSDWIYTVTAELGVAADGTSQGVESYLYDATDETAFNALRTEVTDETTSAGGVTTGRAETLRTDHSGTTKVVTDLDGQSRKTAGGPASAWTTIRHIDDTSDEYTADRFLLVDVDDAAVSGVAITSSTDSKSHLFRTRVRHQQDNGRTEMVGGQTVSFRNDADGTNATKSAWTNANSATASGTDESYAGTKRSFSTERTSGDTGESAYSLVSNGSRTIDASGALSVTGTTHTTQSTGGDTSWDAAEESRVESLIASRPGAGVEVTTETTGESHSTDVGGGTYAAFAEGFAETGAAGIVSRWGSSDHSASAEGNTTDKHDYTTRATTVDAARSKITKTTVANALSSSDSAGHYSTTSTGKASYLGASYSSKETARRDEDGTTTSSTQEVTTVNTVDENDTGIITNSASKTTITNDADGSYTGTSTSVTAAEDGTRSWSEDTSRTDEGSTTSNRVADTESHVVDKSADDVTAKTDTVTHFGRSSPNGTYKAFAESHARGTGGESSSWSSTSRSSDGTYVVESQSTNDFDKQDDTTALSKHSVFHAEDSFDGSGSYSENAAAEEASTSHGAYSAMTETESSSTDAGTSEYKSKSTTTASGTDNIASGVVRTVTESSDSLEEHRSGDYVSTARRTGYSSNNNGELASESVEHSTHQETGDSNYEKKVDSNYTTEDSTTADVDKSDKHESHFADEGGGEYGKTFRSKTRHNADGTSESGSLGDEWQLGESETTNHTTTSSSFTDTTVAGVTKTNNSGTETKEEADSAHLTSTTYSDERGRDGKSSSRSHTVTLTASNGTSELLKATTDPVTTQTDTTTSGTKYYDGQQIDVTKTVNATVARHTERTGEGAFRATSRDETDTADGVTVTSGISARSEAGTFEGKVTEQTDGAKTTEEAGAAFSREMTRSASDKRNYKSRYSGSNHRSYETFGDGTGTSESRETYREDETFTEESVTDVNGTSKVATSANSYVDTTQYKVHDEFRSTNGQSLLETENKSSSNRNGRSSSYRSEKREEEADVESVHSSDQKVYSYDKSVSPRGKYSVVTVTDSDTEERSTSQGDEGRYVSKSESATSVDVNGKSVTNGSSLNTRDEDLTWTEFSKTKTSKVSTGEPGVTDKWKSNDVSNSEGESSDWTLERTDTVENATSKHSESKVKSEGSYLTNTEFASHTHEETGVASNIASDGKRSGKTTSESFDSTTGDISSEKSVVADAPATGPATSKTVTVESITGGKTEWSKHSQINATESGTGDNDATLGRSSNGGSDESGTDNFDNTVTTTRTTNGGSWKKTVEESGDGSGDSEWDSNQTDVATSDLTNHEFVFTLFGAEPITISANSKTRDENNDHGEGDYRYNHSWETTTDNLGSHAVEGDQSRTMNFKGKQTWNENDNSSTSSTFENTLKPGTTRTTKFGRQKSDIGSETYKGGGTVTQDRDAGSDIRYGGSVETKRERKGTREESQSSGHQDEERTDRSSGSWYKTITTSERGSGEGVEYASGSTEKATIESDGSVTTVNNKLPEKEEEFYTREDIEGDEQISHNVAQGGYPASDSHHKHTKTRTWTRSNDDVTVFDLITLPVDLLFSENTVDSSASAMEEETREFKTTTHYDSGDETVSSHSRRAVTDTLSRRNVDHSDGSEPTRQLVGTREIVESGGNASSHDYDSSHDGGAHGPDTTWSSDGGGSSSWSDTDTRTETRNLAADGSWSGSVKVTTAGSKHASGSSASSSDSTSYTDSYGQRQPSSSSRYASDYEQESSHSTTRRADIDSNGSNKLVGYSSNTRYSNKERSGRSHRRGDYSSSGGYEYDSRTNTDQHLSGDKLLGDSRSSSSQYTLKGPGLERDEHVGTFKSNYHTEYGASELGTVYSDISFGDNAFVSLSRYGGIVERAYWEAGDLAWWVYQRAVNFTANPLVSITLAQDAVLDSATEAGKVLADAGAGAIDGLLNTINPFDAWWSVPDIGPVYGNVGAYTVGQVAGTITGIAGSIIVGNVASGASGLAACSGLLVRGAKLYTAVDTAAGFAQAGQHLYEGNAGVGDALAFLPAVSYGVSRALGDVKCFAAGTEVLAAGEGGVGFAEVAIEDVRVGDLVWARDDANPDAPMALKRVTQLFRRQAHDLQSLSLAAEGGHAETLTVTDGHPFWVRGLGWTEAARLTVGMELVTADGATLAVVGNADDYRPDGVTVYNFEVADAHTYFVADGQGDDTFVWAHNACASTSGENIYALNGRQMHNAHADLFSRKGYTTRTALPSGKIPDAYILLKNKAGKITGAVVRELKPNNARAGRRGINQLRRYGRELADLHKLSAKDITLILDTYI